MSRTERLTERFRRLLRRPSTGWVGVDVGASATKLAQVERYQGRWNIVNSVIVENSSPRSVQVDRPLLSSTLRSERFSRAGFRGRKAACALSMSMAELRSLQLPAASEDELRQMVREELDESRDPQEFGLWKDHVAPEEHSETARVSVLAVSRKLAGGIGRELLRAGLRCQVLDGVPFALARAVEMVAPRSAPCAALDWGSTDPTFVLVVDGRPIFSRAFRGCGVRELHKSVCEGLGIARDECWQLLSAYGLFASSPGGEVSHLRQTMSRLAAGPLGQLIEELRRTLSYLKRQSQLVPERIWLFGGGATIRNVSSFIQQQVGISAEVWQLNPNLTGGGQNVDCVQALLGPAVALSALPGEA